MREAPPLKDSEYGFHLEDVSCFSDFGGVNKPNCKHTV